MGEVGVRPGPPRWGPRAMALLGLAAAVTAAVAVVVGLLVLGAQPAAAEGATIVVAQDGSGDYTTIQEAIDNATEGDTIRVWAGTYYENVVVNKTLDLIGNGSDETTIDGGGSGNVVKITADWVNMSGFLVTGSGSPNAGIRIESNKNTLNNNTCSNNEYGISLYNSDDNTLNYNNCSNNDDYGISPYNSDDNTFNNNTCSNNGGTGILLYYSNNNTFTNNTCSDNGGHGIFLWDSDDNTLNYNTCSNNSNVGIYLRYSTTNNTISDNDCLNNDQDGIYLVGSDNFLNNNNCSSNGQDGIYLAGSDNFLNNNNCSSNGRDGIYVRGSNNFLSNNNCSNNKKYSIYLMISDNATLKGNRMWGRGIIIYGEGLEHWNTHAIDTTNLVNGRPVHYYKNTNGTTVLEGVGQVIIANSRDIVVENQNPYNEGVSILVGFSSHITLNNNNCSNTVHHGFPVTSGIFLWKSDHNFLNDNNCSNNGNTGISMWESNNNTLYNNNCSNNGDDGILIWKSNSNTLNNNNCSNNGNDGIDLRGSDNSLTNNNCSGNSRNGVDLEGSDNFLTNNNCSGNGRNGVYLRGSDNSLINNNCSGNGQDGVSLLRSTLNTFTNNNFSSNGRNGISIEVGAHSNVLLNNTITENEIGIYLFDHTKVNNAHYNNIYANRDYGILLYNGGLINATYNWWGDQSGPYHPSQNPTGKGDNISNNVTFVPWLEDGGHPLAYIIKISPSPATDADAVTLAGSGSDADGTVMGWEWWSDIDGLLGENATVTVANLTPGDHNLSFRVMDEREAWSAVATATLHINARPYVVELNVSHDRANEGEPVVFFALARDPDGSVVRYRWNSSLRSYPLTPREDGGPFSLSNLTPGDHTISVQALDDEGAWSLAATAALHINARPTVSVTLDYGLGGSGRQLVTLTGSGADGDGSVVAYEWRLTSPIPEGDVVSTNATFTVANAPEPTGDGPQLDWVLPPGNYRVEFRVQDNEGAWSDSVASTFNVNAPLGEGGDDDDGFLPGPGAATILATMALVALVVAGQRRRLPPQ